MIRLSWYTARRLFPWMAVSVGGAALIFVVTQAMRVAPLFLGGGLGVPTAAKLLALLSVPVVGWALTPGFVVAVFAVAQDMFRNGEQDALDAAGLPRWKVALGPLAAALPLALLSAWIWIYAAPSSQMSVHESAAGLVGRALIGHLEPGRFSSPTGGLTFFAEKKSRNGRFEGVLLEDARDPAHALQVVAPVVELAYRSDSTTLLLKAKDGQLFRRFSKGEVGVMEFGELNLNFGLADEMGQRLGFLPKLMAVSTARLYHKEGIEGASADERWFAFWRRIAGPIGFVSLSIVAVGLAFMGSWRRRRTAIAAAAVLFAWFHLAGRFCEGLMANGEIGPFGAALVPSFSVIIAGCLLIGIRWTKALMTR